MPVMQTKYIWLWPELCEKRSLNGDVSFKTTRLDNIMILIMSGNPTLIYHDKEKEPKQLAPRMFIYISRSEEMTLSCSEHTEISLLRLCHTYKTPRFDLNYICTLSTHVDSFFSVKPRIVVMKDTMFIHITIGALRYELHNRGSDWEMSVTSLLNELFIKLARCYHTQQKFSGIRYIAKARSYIQERYSSPLSVQEIAEHTGISRSYLSCLFSQYMSRSIVEYINLVRCEKAASLLESTQFPIIDIAIDIGFNSRQHFTRTFTNIYGLSPQEYRRMSVLIPPDVSI